MYPVNQVFLGNSDPLLNSTDLDESLQKLKLYEEQLLRAKNSYSKTFIWDSIDSEMGNLTDSQKEKFTQDPEYNELNLAIQNLVQFELLNLVKSKIENSAEGKDLLQKQLAAVKRLKKAVIQETDNEMIIFSKFKEASKNNPSLTYDEFIKQWRNT